MGNWGGRQTLLPLAFPEFVHVDPNLIRRLVAAREDLNSVGDVRRRVALFALVGGFQLLFTYRIDDSVHGARFFRNRSGERGAETNGASASPPTARKPRSPGRQYIHCRRCRLHSDSCSIKEPYPKM